MLSATRGLTHFLPPTTVISHLLETTSAAAMIQRRRMPQGIIGEVEMVVVTATVVGAAGLEVDWVVWAAKGVAVVEGTVAQVVVMAAG